jgi:siderophore synthetase component
MFSPLAFYEQLVVDGHPLHPGAKLKLGLGVGDVIRHSPEWARTRR